MSRTFQLSFANLTCRFGDQLTLLDLANEVVLPAFFDTRNVRKHGLNRFIFRNVGLTLASADGVDRDQLVLYGRLINNTTLVRNQTYTEEEGLKADDATLSSAPSSFFALNLSDHKLMYMPETAYAPSLSQFATVLQSFARTETDRFVRALYESAKGGAEPRTLTSLYAEFPAPDVKATPLSSDENIDAFVESFAKITKMEVKLLSTNAEINRAGDFRAIRAMKDDVGANTTRLVHENSAGLTKGAVSAEAKEAASGGNQRVSLQGVGEDGARFSGSNNDFKLQVSFVDPPENLATRAIEMVRNYFAQVAQGRLRPDEGTPNVEKLKSLQEGLSERIERG